MQVIISNQINRLISPHHIMFATSPQLAVTRTHVVVVCYNVIELSLLAMKYSFCVEVKILGIL